MSAKKVNAASLFLLGLLIASVGLNFYLFSFARRYYLQLNGLRLNPIGLDAFSNEEQIEGLTRNVEVVFFGDSRAASWVAPEIDGFEFLNRGISSQSSVQVRLRYDDHVRPLPVDVLIVQVCINDLKTIGLFPEHKKKIIENCQNSIREITELAREQGAVVILTTVFPVGQVPLERRLFWSDDIPAAVVEVNRFIDSLGGEGVIIFDAYSILADERGELRASYRFDELHLNSAGYEALNRELVDLLMSLEDG
jgi:lysophospholipase L1-like esterase